MRSRPPSAKARDRKTMRDDELRRVLSLCYSALSVIRGAESVQISGNLVQYYRATPGFDYTDDIKEQAEDAFKVIGGLYVCEHPDAVAETFANGKWPSLKEIKAALESLARVPVQKFYGNYLTDKPIPAPDDTYPFQTMLNMIEQRSDTWAKLVEERGQSAQQNR